MLTSESIIRKRAPVLAADRVAALAGVWDDVVDRIMKAMLAQESGIQRELHINIKADMALEWARLAAFLAEQVVTKRVGGRDLEQIDPDAERLECFGPEGLRMIENTGLLAYQEVWLKRMNERWLPRSRKALEREAKPPSPAKLAVKPVRDKHFISRWFIRDYWAKGPNATRWRKSHGAWSRGEILFAAWGHRSNLWGDRLEAYFGLLEGDAKRPIQMLLATEPLNPPQQLAFIAYLVIHLLRNPEFIRELRQSAADVLEQAANDVGVPVEDMARSAYEMLYQDNELYGSCARPLLWSQWAIVSSAEPVFVLPDTFCACGEVEGELRVIVPLTPRTCFVTLAAKESEKRVVPFHHAADRCLARRMSRLLIEAATSEFLSDADFSERSVDTETDFVEVLRSLEVALKVTVQ